MKKMMAAWTTIFLIVLFIPLISHALCVNAPLANLRSGPGKKYKTVWQVYQYMPMEKISSLGNWYRVKDIDGYTEYVYKPLVTSRYRCAAVWSKTANIRTGPGIGYPEKFRENATEYDSFMVLKIKGSWVKVRSDYDQTGWISRGLLWIR